MISSIDISTLLTTISLKDGLVVLLGFQRQKISNSMKGNKNWMFNKHHGNAKQGWYHGIHCDSTWELAFLVYYTEHNLYIESFF